MNTRKQSNPQADKGLEALSEEERDREALDALGDLAEDVEAVQEKETPVEKGAREAREELAGDVEAAQAASVGEEEKGNEQKNKKKKEKPKKKPKKKWWVSGWAWLTGGVASTWTKFWGGLWGGFRKIFGLGPEKVKDSYDGKIEYDLANEEAVIRWPKTLPGGGRIRLTSDIQTNRKIRKKNGEMMTKGRKHQGVDINFVGGTPLEWNSDEEGVVLNNTARYSTSAGYHVEILSEGKVHRFLHMDKRVKVKRGDKVKKGMVFGYSSNTGEFYKGPEGDRGYHLHYEVREHQKDGYPQGPALDPYPYLTPDLQQQLLVRREGKEDKYWQHGGLEHEEPGPADVDLVA